MCFCRFKIMNRTPDTTPPVAVVTSVAGRYLWPQWINTSETGTANWAAAALRAAVAVSQENEGVEGWDSSCPIRMVRNWSTLKMDISHFHGFFSYSKLKPSFTLDCKNPTRGGSTGLDHCGRFRLCHGPAGCANARPVASRSTTDKSPTGFAAYDGEEFGKIACQIF